MKSPKFEQAKLKRAIATNGVEYEFKRPKKNSFGEVASPIEYETALTVVGLYHESTSYVSTTTSEATSYRSKKQPMILTFFDSAKLLKKRDVVVIKNVKYVFNDLRDVENWGIFGDISLEVVDDGKQL